MIILAILASLGGIAVLCWLLFTLAVFALPFFAAVTVGGWAYATGAGFLGTIIIGTVAAGATLGLFQLLLIIAPPTWVRMAVVLAFIAPSVIAGYHATYGIMRLTMPSETWQLVFSIIGAVAVGITAFMRLTLMGPPGPTRQDIARAS